MFNKLKELKAMQAKAEEIKKRLESITVKGTAAEDKVQVICTGNKTVQNVIIDESLLTPESKTELEQQMVVAINHAFQQAESVMNSEMQSVAGGMFGN